MTKKKNKRKQNTCCNIFDNATLPPCTNFLGSANPLILDGKIIYKNYNRLYFFLTFNRQPENIPTYNTLDPTTYISTLNGNLQIQLYHFIIGIFINEIQKGNIKNYKDIKIHEDDNADRFIKNVLNSSYELNTSFMPSLAYTISNSNSVASLLNGNITISPINYYIIFMLSRFYGDYGMLYSDNSYVTPDYINYALANMYFVYN